VKKIFLIYSVLGCLLCNSINAVPAQVVIIGHSETDANGNLSQTGQERSAALSIYLTETPQLINFGLPISIFAARPMYNQPPFPTDEISFREIDTVRPLAGLLKMPIHSGYAAWEEERVADFILNECFYDGEYVVIAWPQEHVADLAFAFGVTPFPSQYPSDEYDLTWLITFDPEASLQILHQRLLQGDPDIVP
jgi:hypothetical protein